MGRYKKGWTAEHQEVLKQDLAGKTQREITEDLGLKQYRVNQIQRSQKYKLNREKAIEGGVSVARKVLEHKLVAAANKIISVMESGKPEDRLRFDAAKEILYQCGMKPVEVVETRTRQYTPEELASTLQTVKEIQTIEGTLAIAGSAFLVKKTPEELTVDPTPVAASVHAGAADMTGEPVKVENV